jgi:cytochrome c
MIRCALAALLVLFLTACGQAARESDNPAPDGSPGTGGQAAGRVAAQAPAAFGQCGVCHTTEPGKHLVGPSLAGVYGQSAASAAGYPYSAALKQAGLTWDDATLGRFLEAPMKTVPGTRMTHAGLKDPAARDAVIAYMKSL